jgi:hypothetical protein
LKYTVDELSKLDGAVCELFLALAGTEVILHPKTFPPLCGITVNPGAYAMSKSPIHIAGVSASIVVNPDVVVTHLVAHVLLPLSVLPLPVTRICLHGFDF